MTKSNCTVAAGSSISVDIDISTLGYKSVLAAVPLITTAGGMGYAKLVVLPERLTTATATVKLYNNHTGELSPTVRVLVFGSM